MGIKYTLHDTLGHWQLSRASTFSGASHGDMSAFMELRGGEDTLSEGALGVWGSSESKTPDSLLHAFNMEAFHQVKSAIGHGLIL